MIDAATKRADESRGRWWFVMRKYPPGIGGMERLSYEVTTRLARRHRIELLAMKPRRWRLPGFLVVAAARLAAACIRRQVALVHLGDAVLAPLGLVARLYRIPCSVVVHGLDVVHDKGTYPAYRKAFLRGFGVYICNSESTRAAAIRAGLPAERIRVIGAGIDVVERGPHAIDRDLGCILFVGRLVQRKGLRWFVEAVMPTLAKRHAGLRLVIIGGGPERQPIERAAASAGVTDRLVWLGRAGDDVKALWLERAGVCVMPNVVVPGDIEGFGIVALEAAAAGCPVIAADIEGLCDAVTNGESGTLVPSGDAASWVAAVETLLGDAAVNARAGARARSFVHAHCGWDPVIDAYDRVLTDVARKSSGRTR